VQGKASVDICDVKENDVVDKVTGISFPIHRSFPYAGKGKDFSLLGAGPRRKNLFVVEVNVYSVGLYVESGHMSKLKQFKGKDAEGLSKEKGYYATLMKEKNGMNRALELVFARGVPAGKVVEALSALEGVKEDVLTDFKGTLLKAIGTSVGKGETITLAWTVRRGKREGGREGRREGGKEGLMRERRDERMHKSGQEKRKDIHYLFFKLPINLPSPLLPPSLPPSLPRRTTSLPCPCATSTSRPSLAWTC